MHGSTAQSLVFLKIQRGLLRNDIRDRRRRTPRQRPVRALWSAAVACRLIEIHGVPDRLRRGRAKHPGN
jgi:hypothetical protein